MAVSHVFNDPGTDWTGTVTVFNSQGSTTTVAATNLVRGADWNSAHNQFYTLSGNTSNASTASGTNVVLQALGDMTLIGSTGTIGLSGGVCMSSFMHPAFNADANTSSSAFFSYPSVSQAVAFALPQNISCSFIRLPISQSAASTTLSTSAATLNGSAEYASTWNAVFYTLGTGANSRSLQSVASGSGSFLTRNSVSANTAGSQYTVTQAITYLLEGNTSSTSSSYACSTSNYNFASALFTDYNSVRFVDIPFASSLDEGPYWMVVGVSTSSNANSARASSATGCGAFFTSIIGHNQQNAPWGVMGGTDLTGGGFMGAGVFSTAGGGTTASIPLSAISSQQSYFGIYFQLLRSA